jgi:RNA-binding protein
MEEIMTSKRRAELRAQANILEPLFQVGKGGVSDALIAQTEDALRVHELIKLKVLLESAPDSPKAIAAEIAEKTGSQVVQVVGGSMIFYKENPELKDGKKKKATVKKSGTGKGAKDFKKVYNKINKRKEEQEAQKRTYSKFKRYYKPKTDRTAK